MNASSRLRPRPERGLSVRTSDLARRILSGLTARAATTLVVGRSCPYAHLAATVADETTVTVDAADEVAAQLSLHDVSLVLVGADVRWPPEDHPRALNSVPILRWRSSDRDTLQRMAILRGGVTEITILVPEASLHAVRVEEADTCQHVLLPRARRLGSWLASPQGRALADIPEPELVVRGGRVVALDKNQVEPRGIYLTALGYSVESVPDVDGLTATLESEPVDLLLLDECEVPALGRGERPDLLHSLTEQGVSCLTFCGCRGISCMQGMPAISSCLFKPFDFAEFHAGVSRALLDRLAWLFDRGLPSSHLVIGAEDDPCAAWRRRS